MGLGEGGEGGESNGDRCLKGHCHTRNKREELQSMRRGGGRDKHRVKGTS